MAPDADQWRPARCHRGRIDAARACPSPLETVSLDQLPPSALTRCTDDGCNIRCVLGYCVLPFNDPLLALEALRDNPQRFDAVSTYEVMPRLSGTQLTEAMRVFAPELPVLLISGYAPQLGSRAALAV